MKNVIIAILVAIVLVFAFLFFTQKESNVSYEPWPETEPSTVKPTNDKPQTDPIDCAPSINVSSPVQGTAYTTGQQVAIKWTSCGVQNVNISLVSGGKDHGQITQTSIPASQGSYQWTATNPGKGFTGLSTNSYQIGVTSGSVIARSGTFTVTTPAPAVQALSPAFLQVLVDGGKIDRITKFTYDGSIYYSAFDNEAAALDGGSEIYNSTGVIVEGCGGNGPGGSPAICKTQNRSQIEIIYTR